MLPAELHHRAKEVLARAEALAPGERADFVARACGGNTALLREARRLLELAERTPESFLEPAGDAVGREPPAGGMRLDAGQGLGPYTVLAPLGRGGMGEVYRAHDPRLDREVAIKLLPAEVADDRERRQRFEREARTLARVNHPGILTIYDVGEHSGKPFLVTELLEGETLRRRLDGGPLPWLVAVRWAGEIAEGLATAHDHGIVHRDLKPANLWITRDERIKILDFGIAKVEMEAGAAETTVDRPPTALTDTGRILGTTDYMSPEQVRGLAVDGRSDIFSLGAVLYEMVSGRRPFDGASAIDVLGAILHEEAPALALPRGCPRALGALVARCLAKQPGARFAGARDLSLALQTLCETPPTARPDRVRTEDGPVPPRIAVLPFADLSPQRDQDYLCEGIADELISVLTAIPGLQVASRPATFRQAASGLDVRAIGSELGVAALLEGTVRRTGQGLHVTARLLDMAGGYYLWSERFDRRPDDVFAIQDEIARSVVDALGLLPEETMPAADRLPTTRLEAYETYLCARQQFHRMLRQSLEGARRLYRQAIELDPAFALAHAGLADSSAFLYMDWGGDPAHLADAQESSRRAVAVGPGHAETHASRALTLSVAGDWAAAEREFEAALRLNPKLYEACYFYGRSWVSRGNLDRAADWFERAVAVRPESYDALILLAMARLGRWRLPAAEDAFRLAFQAVEKHLELEPGEVRALAIGAQALAGQGDVERAVDWARRAHALASEDPGALWNVGAAFAMVGDRERALCCLEPAIRHCTDLPWVDHDSLLDGVRGDPRFQALLAAAWERRGGRPRRGTEDGRRSEGSSEDLE